MSRNTSLEQDLITVLIKHKILDRTALIKIKYDKLKKSGISPKQARLKLADEYFLSESAIQYYLYHRKT